MTPEQILTEADHCVKCGLCLAHCPTYQVSRDEGESPRGRVTLIQAVASGMLPSRGGLARHLANCLLCRACESACPSGVRYGELIDGARRLQFLEGSLRPDPLTKLISRQAGKSWSREFARLYRSTGLARLGERLGGDRIRRLNSLAPEIPASLPTPDNFYGCRGEKRGLVGLFIGCIGNIAERPALFAAIRLLTRLGYDVSLPAGQGCCGALAYHGGDHDDAARLAEANRRAFGSAGVEVVLTLSSGCGAHLADYARVAHPLDAGVSDISHFLCSIEWPSDLSLRPMPARIALHTPCSLENGLKQAAYPGELLARIPGLEIEPLEALACCGAGGSQMLANPSLADSVGEPLLNRAEELSPDIIVSSNIGCALHIAAGLRARGSGLKIRHPVELIAQQLGIEAGAT